jgi:RNA polymerase sigma-32 factor
MQTTSTNTSSSVSRYGAPRRSQRLLEAPEERKLIRQAQAGDRQAMEQLCSAYAPLVLKHALRSGRTFRVAPNDLVQEGMIGLIEAVRHFDASKKVRLSTYALWWIRALVLRHVLSNWRLVRVGTTQAQRAVFFDLQKERHLLERHGKTADFAVLARRMGIPEDELRDLERHFRTPETALDAPVEGPDRTIGDGLVDLEPLPDELAAQHERSAQLRTLVRDFQATLGERERQVIERRWLAVDPAALRELAKGFGVSGERVRQLECQLVDRFRRFAQDQALQGVGAELLHAA